MLVRKFKKWYDATNKAMVGSTDVCRGDTLTPSCGTDTNVWFVRRWARTGDGYSWPNNFVHECAHAFGRVHVTQYAAPNRCDLAYVEGNLAGAILHFRASGAPLAVDSSLSPALVSELRAEGMMA